MAVYPRSSDGSLNHIMIETRVPMDVRSYKAKLIGPFTTRQITCITITACVDLLAFFTIITPLNIPTRPAVFFLACFDCLILTFILEPNHMPMEQYLKNVLLRSLIAPTKRKAASPGLDPVTPVHTSKEVKTSKRKMKKLLKKHPELKAYK